MTKTSVKTKNTRGKYTYMTKREVSRLARRNGKKACKGV